MTNPIDIIAENMRRADGNHTMGTGALAEVAARALTDDRIVDQAGLALHETLFEHLREDGTLEGVDLNVVARVVLRSVGGA